MSVALPSPRQLRQLDAMGVVAYRLRTSTSAVASAQVPAAADVILPAGAVLTVVSDQPPAAAARVIAAALGLAESALHWQMPRDGRLPELDQGAAAFLVLGGHLARILGAELPTPVQQAATIVVTTAPQQWRGDAMAKRLLWQALRPLRRQLREQAWSPS